MIMGSMRKVDTKRIRTPVSKILKCMFVKSTHVQDLHSLATLVLAVLLSWCGPWKFLMCIIFPSPLSYFLSVVHRVEYCTWFEIPRLHFAKGKIIRGTKDHSNGILDLATSYGMLLQTRWIHYLGKTTSICPLQPLSKTYRVSLYYL